MKTQLILIILFSFAFSKLCAQCPEGDVALLSQAEVENFVAIYPNCTQINGNLKIGEPFVGGTTNSIIDISGLTNLTKVNGSLTINNTNLSDLEGLNNLDFVGGLTFFYNKYLISIQQLSNIHTIQGSLIVTLNRQLPTLEGLNNLINITGSLIVVQDNLRSLSGLNNLTSIGGGLSINVTSVENLDGLNNLVSISGAGIFLNQNLILNSISGLSNLKSINGGIYISLNNLQSLDGLQNINPTTIGGEGLEITNNQNLTACNLPNICEYLSWDSVYNPRIIWQNSGNCTNEQAILSACALGVNDVESDMANWQVHYKKENNSFLVQSKGFQISDIQIYNLKGQLIKEINNLNSNREEINVFSAENILIIKIISTDGKSFAKKVILK